MKNFKFKKIQKMHLKSLNKIVFIQILFFFLFRNYTFSQSLESVSKEEELVYLRTLCMSDLFLRSTYMSLDEYCDLLKQSHRIFKIDTLRSEGFSNVVFIRISFQGRDSLNKLYSDLEQKGNFIRKIQYLQGAESFIYPFLSEHEYIFATSPFGIFKLKGFRIDDFKKFYSHCYNLGTCFENEKLKKNKHKWSDKRIIKNLKVEELNLWKLYKE